MPFKRTVSDPMNRRKILTSTTAAIALVGLAFVATPFIGSMSPNKAARSNAKVRVTISDIPDVGALEVDYRWYKALVVKNPEMAVFLMPYWEGAYRLPDPTWDRPFVPCKNFLINEEGFACKDTSLHESWNERARWDYRGSSKGSWMPDLQKTNFKVQGKYLILSPEYN